jgi:hypothetical protein
MYLIGEDFHWKAFHLILRDILFLCGAPHIENVYICLCCK